MPPPSIGETFIRRCRGHYHLCFCCVFDDDFGFDDVIDISLGLTLEEATRRLLHIDDSVTPT